MQIELQTEAAGYCRDKKAECCCFPWGPLAICWNPLFFPSGPEALLVKGGPLRAVIHLAGGEEKRRQQMIQVEQRVARGLASELVMFL